MKIYKREKNIFHNVVNGMVVFLTIAIIGAWIYKGVFPVQAIAGYFVVLGSAVMIRANQTYVELDNDELRIINVKNPKLNKSFVLGTIDCVSFKRAGVEGYMLEIKVGNRITGCTVTQMGKREKNALLEDLRGKEIAVN